MPDAASLRVSVLLAQDGAALYRVLELPAGSTAWQAVETSDLLQGRRDLDPTTLAVAVFGKQVPREHVLEDGDRVEILRPLHEDPKSRRRRAARAGKAPGRR